MVSCLSRSHKSLTSLAELHLADSRMLLDETSPDSLRVNILTSYGLDEKTYDELVTFLSDNPDRLATIYSKVVDKVVEAGDSVPEGDE